MKTKQPQRGRPRKDPEDSLIERLQIRAGSDEKAEFERAASKADMSLSDWIRNRLTKAARRELGTR